MLDEILSLNSCIRSAAQARKSCRSRRELSTEQVVLACKNRLRLRRERASESLPRTSHKFEGEKLREQTQVLSLLHVPGETRLFAGLSNGALVSVDLASGEIGSRAALGAPVGFLCLF